MRSASPATRLASAARSSPDETLKPIVENWLGVLRAFTRKWNGVQGSVR